MGKTIFYSRSAAVNFMQCEKQEDALKAYAKKHGITDYTIMCDCGYTNYTVEKNGPMFKQIIEAVYSGEVEQIVVCTPDRISRNLARYLDFKEFCDAHCVSLIFASVSSTKFADNVRKVLEDFSYGKV